MKILVTFATVAVAVGAPFAASAQTYRETIYDLRSESAAPVYTVSDIDRPAYSSGLPPYEVLTIVRSMGFEPQSRPVRRGGVYVVRAFDDQDIPVRVIVDARSGRVVNVAERGPMQDDEGPVVEQRYSSAYPVPPRAVPGGEIYRETDDRGPEYRSPEYRAPNYRAPDYRSSDTRVYTPAPYAPSTTRSIAPRPRIAARTPAKVTPTPRTRPATAATNAAPAVTTTPATPPKTQAAVTPPQATPTTPVTATPKGSATQAAAPPAAKAAVAQDTSHRGTSIPAPVASRKVEAPAAESPAAKPDTPAKSADPSLVPVAPLD